ncbi:putative quinol monooxygenase [Mycobacterium sp. pUA109]|uniref:putative quinol monooxygenase n=1 Tax=Mycobacterium sp. pUA109 TaxID=3238982 RepID=UPI00351BE7A7
MGEIQLRATFPNIANEQLEEFKALAQDAVVSVRGEAGALQYDWFLSDDQTKCVVLEKYESSEAVLAHLANAGALIGRLAKLGGGLDIEVFGDVSPELRQALAATGPPFYAYFNGF